MTQYSMTQNSQYWTKIIFEEITSKFLNCFVLWETSLNYIKILNLWNFQKYQIFTILNFNDVLLCQQNSQCELKITFEYSILQLSDCVFTWESAWDQFKTKFDWIFTIFQSFQKIWHFKKLSVHQNSYVELINWHGWCVSWEVLI